MITNGSKNRKKILIHFESVTRVSKLGLQDMGLCRKHKIAKEHDELVARKKKLMQ